jgi:glycosyltransferase involved in cell wall biosynthesis
LFHANLLGRFAAYSAGIQHVISGIRVAEKQARWHLFFDRWTNKLVEKYVCVSQSVAAYSRLAGRLPNEKIVVIPNGIDCEQIQKTLTTVSPILPQGNRILFVGRLTQQKGLDWLLESADKWLLKLPGWKLWIVGDGEERSRLEKMLQESSLQKQVKFLGWRSDVAELLAVSKILILPSRWEGMPNVILQAMAAGLPVVTTEVEGIAELLGENAAEQTCRFGDSEILSKRILTLATDSDFAEQLGNKNRQRAEELFSIDSIVRQYEDFFSAIQKL